MGAPASGKCIEVSGIDIARLKDGRMVEHWGIFDGMAMMGQLGLMPGTPTGE
jgi:predicted ester cyclase